MEVIIQCGSELLNKSLQKYKSNACHERAIQRKDTEDCNREVNLGSGMTKKKKKGFLTETLSLTKMGSGKEQEQDPKQG